MFTIRIAGHKVTRVGNDMIFYHPAKPTSLADTICAVGLVLFVVGLILLILHLFTT